MHLTKKTNEVTDSADRPACECEIEITPAMIEAGVRFADSTLQELTGEATIRYLVEGILDRALKARACSHAGNTF